MATSPVSIAGNSSAAAAGGSVIDVGSLVSQLVAATRAPQDSIISKQTQAVTTQISAVGTLKGALSTFQSSLTALDTPGAFNSESAKSSDTSVFTTSTTTDAVGGAYTITVSQLAKAQQLVSTAFSGGASAAVGTGTLTLSLGSASFDLSVDSSHDTLAGIAAAINSAADNPGISATIVNGTDGAHLVLSSSQTGASNTIQVTETDGGTALAALTYGTGNAANYTVASAAQDASFTIAGITHTGASNTVDDALTGVTLYLRGTTAAGASATLTVANDLTSATGNITAFVTAYNTLQSALKPLGSYDSTTQTAGPMLGDTLLSGVQSQIGSVLHGLVSTASSTYNSLASVGITTNSDGTLSLNSSTLQTALSTNFTAVSQLFSGSSGIATRLNAGITAQLAENGPIGSRSQTLVKQENSLTQQTNALNDQMTALTASLTRQYSALNSLLSSLQTTSAYLSQAFAGLPQVQGRSNA
jgi:flagellar hook-associated protein 2